MSDVRLAHLRDLRDGWDSYGGKAPTRAAIATAESLVFVPTTDGGVQVELHTPTCWTELSIGPDGAIDHCAWGPS